MVDSVDERELRRISWACWRAVARVRIQRRFSGAILDPAEPQRARPGEPQDSTRSVHCEGGNLFFERTRMIVRLWTAKVDPARIEQYELWERPHSLPMFAAFTGCLGVLFLRFDDSCCALSFLEGYECGDRTQAVRALRSHEPGVREFRHAHRNAITSSI